MATLSLENRILTLTNDDGTTSSVDLAEVKGDMGVRGPQGIAGPAADLSNYYTKQETEQKINAALPPSAEEVDY